MSSIQLPARGVRSRLLLLVGTAAALLPVTGTSPAAAAPGTAAVSRYVAPGGADSGSCTSSASPCATISYAVVQAAAGDTIEVKGTIHDRVTIDKSITISGALAPAGSPAVLDGSGAGRVVTVNAGTVALRSLRVQNGSGNNGGGIFSSGSLTLVDTVVSANTAATGAGIYNWGGNLTVVRSTVTGNTANACRCGFGGGGLFTGHGSVTLTDSTLSANSASDGDGGGIYYYSGSVALLRSTVSGNSASRGGGFVGSNITVTNSTVSGNSAVFGAGFWATGPDAVTVVDSTIAGNVASGSAGGFLNNYGTVVLGGTIVTANGGGNCEGTSGPGSSPISSLGYNLTADATGDACGLIQPTDRVNADARLGPLADNGGPTRTMLPGTGSAALDRIPRGTVLGGVQACLGADQRGIARPQPQRSHCAIGAVEPGAVVAAAPVFTSAAAASTSAGAAIGHEVRASGAPTPSLRVSSGSTLPSGLGFTDRADGTGVLQGSVTRAGIYTFTLLAANGVAPDATQDFTLTVQPGPTVSLALSPASATIASGASQAYSATGFDAYGNSKGDVTSSTTFSIAPGASGSATGASCSGNRCTATAAGSYTVTGRLGSATGTATLVVGKTGTSTALRLSHPTVTYGNEQVGQLSVTVTPAVAGSTPGGKVKIKTGGTTLCTITLSAGSGSCTLGSTQLPGGSHQLVAAYTGNSKFAGSSSGPATLTVAKAATATALSLSSETVAYGHEDDVELTVTVTPEYAGTPAGTAKVKVKDTGALVCSVTLSAGTGSCRLTSTQLPVGTHNLVASYKASTSFTGSTSPRKRLTVTS